MEFWTAAIVGACLVAFALGWLVRHVRNWRLLRDADLPEEELNYYRRQYRRRMQASLMIAVLGVGLPVGAAIEMQKFPTLYVSFWCALMLLSVWICLLAAGDLVSTRTHFGRRMRDNALEQVKLRAEIEQIRVAAAQHGGGRLKGNRRFPHPPAEGNEYERN